MPEAILWIGGAIVACFLLVVFWGAPYVPTRKRQLNQAFDELYQLKPTDVVIDVGAGDGVVLRAAAERGAKAVGYELNPLLVLVAKWLGRKYGSRMVVRWKDFWRQTLPPETTVVYAFLEGRDIAKMERFLLEQAKARKQPLYFISYGFELPDIPPQKKVGAMVLYEFATERKNRG
ncbi:MAG TPA: hypothetical protein VD907_04650 [Verrucomicrobiae bacterium]|nr:hypothetical protein [Verrucomicrobiae bacterium]